MMIENRSLVVFHGDYNSITIQIQLNLPNESLTRFICRACTGSNGHIRCKSTVSFEDGRSSLLWTWFILVPATSLVYVNACHRRMRLFASTAYLPTLLHGTKLSKSLNSSLNSSVIVIITFHISIYCVTGTNNAINQQFEITEPSIC